MAFFLGTNAPDLMSVLLLRAEPRGVEEGALETFLKRYKVAAARYTAKPGRGRQLHAGAGAGKGLPGDGVPAEGGGLGVAAEPSNKRAASAPARRRRAGGGAIMFAVFRGKASERSLAYTPAVASSTMAVHHLSMLNLEW